MKIILTSILFYLSLVLNAQNQNSKWYFGNLAGLDFMSNPPTILNNSASNSWYGCSTISDASGNLLFYTDGHTVYDQSHSVMANGNGLGVVTNTNQLHYQYSAIVKQPGNSNIYYVFSNCPTNTLAGLYCSTVDMSLAAGMGSVTIKNALVSNVVHTGMMTAAIHCNNKDVWLVTHEHGNTNFRAFLITAAGVNTVPVISPVYYAGATSSYLKASPTGKKLAALYNNSFPSLFDFNNTTGVVSNSLSLTNIPWAAFMSFEFSPDGTKLYCTYNMNDQKLFQWDLCAGSPTAIVASVYTMVTTSGSYGIQLAPNGKIYIPRHQQTSLAVINNPNSAGAACNYVDIGQSLGTGTCNYNLPGFVSSPFPSPSFTYSSKCQTISFTNTAGSSTAITNCSSASYSLTSVLWNFGDPLTGSSNTSAVNNPSHQYSGLGTFTTTLILNYLCHTDTLKQVINVTTASPTFAVSGPTTVCKGDLAILTVTPAGANVYSWSNGANTTSISLTPSTNVSYTVVGTSTVTGCSWQKVVSLNVSNCTGFENNGMVMENVLIYPNPASDVIIVESTSNLSESYFELNLFDQLGQSIIAVKINSPRQEINLNELARGVYFLKLKTLEKTAIKKLIIE